MDPSSFKFIRNHTPLTSPGCTEGNLLRFLLEKTGFPILFVNLVRLSSTRQHNLFLLVGWLVVLVVAHKVLV